MRGLAWCGEEGSVGGGAAQRAWRARSVVEAMLYPRGSQVVTVDVRNKKAVFKDGFKLEYSKLLLAPGSRWEGSRNPSQAEGWGRGREPPLSPILAHLSPKTLSCKGKDVENVFTIRTPEDANRVVRLARGRNAVVVGAGFLGEQPGEPGVALAGVVQGASPRHPPCPRDGGGRLPD